MVGLDDLVAGVVGGATWGVGFVVATGAVLVAGPRAKPLAKYAIRGYFAASQRAREVAAEAVEQLQDLYAEAKYEHESELTGGDSGDDVEAPRRRRGTAASEQPA
jgi:hypothetical protein